MLFRGSRVRAHHAGDADVTATRHRFGGGAARLACVTDFGDHVSGSCWVLPCATWTRQAGPRLTREVRMAPPASDRIRRAIGADREDLFGLMGFDP